MCWRVCARAYSLLSDPAAEPARLRIQIRAQIVELIEELEKRNEIPKALESPVINGAPLPRDSARPAPPRALPRAHRRPCAAPPAAGTGGGT